LTEFILGFQARLDGLFAKDCPFPAGSPEAVAWIEGWTDRATVWMVKAEELPQASLSN
jgi:hypothetical protein